MKCLFIFLGGGLRAIADPGVERVDRSRARPGEGRGLLKLRGRHRSKLRRGRSPAADQPGIAAAQAACPAAGHGEKRLVLCRGLRQGLDHKLGLRK